MGSNLQIRRETFSAAEDQSWLKTRFGTDDAHSITINGAAAGAVAGVVNGFLKSGTLMGKVTAGGLYSPYSNADAPAGVGVALGILLTSIQLVKTDAGVYADSTAALMWHGDVIIAKLTGYDAAGATDLGTYFKFN